MYGFFTKTLVRLLGGTASFIAFSFAARYYSAQMIAKIFAISAVYGVVMAIVKFVNKLFTAFLYGSAEIDVLERWSLPTCLPWLFTSLGLSILLQAYLMMSGIGIWMSIILGFTTFCTAFSLETNTHPLAQVSARAICFWVRRLGGDVRYGCFSSSENWMGVTGAVVARLFTRFVRRGVFDRTWYDSMMFCRQEFASRVLESFCPRLGFFSVTEHVAFNFPQIVLEKFDTSAAVSFGAGYRAFAASVSMSG